jgi:hypothetical protein
VIAQRSALPELDDSLLAGPIRRATGSNRAKVVEWRCEPIAWTAIASTTAGIYRVSGTARDSRGTSAGLWGGISAPVWLPIWGNPSRRAWLDEKFGRPLEEAAAPYARALAFMLDLGDEAWSLLSSMA